MRTRMLVAAVLVLGVLAGVAVRAQGGRSPIRTGSRGGPSIDMRTAEDGRNRVRVEALAGDRIGRHVELPLSRDEPARVDEEQQDKLDTLDEARIECELLEMEVAVDRQHFQKIMTALKETELQKYKMMLARVREDFVAKSKALARERRRVADLEAQLHLTAASPAPPPAGLQWKDAERILDLILKGVETWQRASSTSPPPSPVDPPLKDAERLLELLRNGVETWQGSPSPSPAPSPSPVEPRPKDAERLLELILRGVETWQRQ